MTMRQKQTISTVATPGSKAGAPSMLISTVHIDRDSDVLVPEGADFTAYQKNPVVAWMHLREDAMPVGSTTHLTVEPGRGIRATWRWLEGDPLADRVRNAFEQGVLRAASVGFLPNAWEPLSGGGRKYTRWELCEWSLVAVPSNREAVRVLRGLDLWSDEDDSVLEIDDDGDELLTLPEADDETFEVDPRVLGAAIAEAVTGGLRSQVAQSVRREIDVRRGRLPDYDAVLLIADDADAMRVRRAELRQQKYEVSLEAIAESAREVVPEVVREVLRDAARAGIRRAVGRLD